MSVKQYGWLVKTLRDETCAELQVSLKRTWSLKHGYGLHADAFAEDVELGPVRGRGFSKTNKFEAVRYAIIDWGIVLMEKAIDQFSKDLIDELVESPVTYDTKLSIGSDSCGCKSCGCSPSISGTYSEGTNNTRGSNGEGQYDSSGPQGRSGKPGIVSDELKEVTAEKTGEKLAEPEE